MTEVLPNELSPTEHSSSLARMVEFQFLADLLQEAWLGRGMVLDVMHSSVDAFGYDLVLESGRVIRHVQLKARKKAGKASQYGINTALRERPSGCVVWIGYEKRPDANRLDLEYRFLGGAPGERLPHLGDAPVLHTKANKDGVKAVRPNLRNVRLTSFHKCADVTEVLDMLFGPEDGA